MKFSIRDLFLVTVIVALAVGWWVDRSRLVTSVEELKLEKIRFVLRSHSELSRGLIVSPNSSSPAANPPKP
jgi:hypothetical protein